MNAPLKIVIIGLSVTSSWGNGHATTYRGLMRELAARGHDVLFLERDVAWYAANRDLPEPPYGRTRLYASVEALMDGYAAELNGADLVIVGSHVPDGVAVGEWAIANAGGLCAFYDIDTPVTLAKLEQRSWQYISPALIPRYDLYLSFTGGPALRRLEEHYGAPRARPLYCSVDPNLYHPMTLAPAWDLGYLGTYAEDRQPTLERLLTEVARRWPEGRFAVAGPMYPESIAWPRNVTRFHHLPPAEHRRFYNSQRATLNATRADMARLGWSPSVRLFEAAACGTPIISDRWPGLDELFAIGEEILVADTTDEVLSCLRDYDEDALRALGARARQRILAQHTAAHRAAELEGYVYSLLDRTARRRAAVVPLRGALRPGTA